MNEIARPDTTTPDPIDALVASIRSREVPGIEITERHRAQLDAALSAELSERGTSRRRNGRWLAAAAAVGVIAVTATSVRVAIDDAPDEPLRAHQGEPSDVPVASETPGVLVRIPEQPGLFPAVDPAPGLSVIGFRSSTVEPQPGGPVSNPPSASWTVGVERAVATVGRVENGAIRDAVTVEVFHIDHLSTVLDPYEHDVVVIDGREVDRYTEPGPPGGDPPATETIAIPTSGAVVTYTGRDVAAFLEGGGADTAVGGVTSDRTPTLELGDVPAGYSVVVQPLLIPGVLTSVSLQIDGPSMDGVVVSVGSVDLRSVLAPLADLTPAVVGGVDAWVTEDGNAAIWAASPTSWVLVGGAGSSEANLSAAAEISFVSDEEWSEMFGRPDDQPVVEGPDDADVTATTATTVVHDE